MYWHTQLPMRSLQNRLHGLHPKQQTNKQTKQNRRQQNKQNKTTVEKQQNVSKEAEIVWIFLRVLINNKKKSLKDSCTHFSIWWLANARKVSFDILRWPIYFA